MDNALEDSTRVTASSAGIATGLIALAHLFIIVVLLGIFLAATSWHALSPSLPAAGLSVVAGLLAGAIITTLVHEWFHYAGALAVRGQCHPIKRLNLFAFDWDFKRNTRAQFLVMSYAGTVGSIASIALLHATLADQTPGAVALLAAAFGSLAFAGAIEWPVLARVQGGGDPLSELSKISPRVLLLSAAVSLLTALATAWMLA